MIYVAGIGIALLIEILLLSKKNKSGSDKILTVWMFVILLHLFLFYLHYTEKAYAYPFMLGVGFPLPLLHGVLLYLYVASLTDQLPERRWILGLHFAPALAAFAYLTPFFILPAERKIEIFASRGADYQVFNTVLLAAIMASGIFYISWSALLLKRHAVNIRDRFSDIEKIHLQWLRILTYGLGGIWGLVVFLAGDALIYAAVVLFIFLIGFFGVRQTDIFSLERSISAGSETKPKYQKSGLSDEASNELHRRLIDLMKRELLYKKSDLSIDDLGSRLGVHPNYLSQVINQREKKNFYDFVNGYRIDEFKRLVGSQQNLQFTLLSLAHDCGFSSKTSFNRYFRKSTGETPSAYIARFSKESAHSA